MDILSRLRIAFWLLIVTLWGIVVYQFLGGSNPNLTQMQWIANPFSDQPAPTPSPLWLPQDKKPRISTHELVRNPFPNAQPEGTPATSAEAISLPSAKDSRLASAAPPGQFIRPLPSHALPNARPIRQRRGDTSLRRHEYLPLQEPEAPSGFFRTVTPHFYVFSEGGPPSKQFLETLENLHGNIMLDLASFSPWAHDERVSIYLFRSQDNYRRVTGRPAWSGGASSVSRRKIYLYESEELIGILAHELCHIYFDSFFLAGTTDPLWLSEGMATLVQIERGLTSPNWLPENLEVLYHGGGFSLSDLFGVENTAGANDDNVRLWYTESYSVVRFLMRAQWRSSFYHFCRNLRDGTPVATALYRAYGMPFNRVKALEYAWRYDIETHRITNLQAGRQ